MVNDESRPIPVPEFAIAGLNALAGAAGESPWEPRGALRWLRDNGFYSAADWVEQHPQAFLDYVRATAPGDVSAHRADG
ncbi:MAG: hypothetical protein KF886_25405 [Candidatus Hydrogenedentes bacterium]|nr:hypothetical protein [Candidatus Hydrogenedentota bacterium]